MGRGVVVISFKFIVVRGRAGGVGRFANSAGAGNGSGAALVGAGTGAWVSASGVGGGASGAGGGAVSSLFFLPPHRQVIE